MRMARVFTPRTQRAPRLLEAERCSPIALIYFIQSKFDTLFSDALLCIHYAPIPQLISAESGRWGWSRVEGAGGKCTRHGCGKDTAVCTALHLATTGLLVTSTFGLVSSSHVAHPTRHIGHPQQFDGRPVMREGSCDVVAGEPEEYRSLREASWVAQSIKGHSFILRYAHGLRLTTPHSSSSTRNPTRPPP